MLDRSVPEAHIPPVPKVGSTERNPSFPFLRSLPPAPNVDVSEIKGNLSLEEKQLAANVFAHFIGTGDDIYSARIGQRIRTVEMNAWNKEGTGAEAQTIHEIVVAPDMCNAHGKLHGGCAAYIVDPCSLSAIIVLGIASGVDSLGVSQAMNLIWHAPASVGTKITIINTSISIKGKVRSARSEFWDLDKGKLLVSAVHSTMGLPSPLPAVKQKL